MIMEWPFWMDTMIAAAYCGFGSCKSPADAFRQWADQAGVIADGAAGRRPRWSRPLLDRAMRVVHVEERAS